MNFTNKTIMLAAVSAAILGGVFVNGQQLAMAGENGRTNNDNKQNEGSKAAIPLKEAKLIIEHNAKANDTGFQGFIDSEGWKRITVTGPDGKVLDFKGTGALGSLRLTELFFESVEPANADVPIGEVLRTLPEGNYVFKGSAIEAGEKQGTTIGTALLTHDIPAGPGLLSPAENATVPEDKDLLVRWSPVDKTIDGRDINIIAYQLIIEKDEEPHPNMIGKFGLSMYLPASVTQITIPDEFLEPGTNYLWEVLAIEERQSNSKFESVQY